MINPEVVGHATVRWAMEVGELGATHDVVQFTSGLVLTHQFHVCRDTGPCAIHDPSQHHMRHLPVFYRSDRYIVERCCAHGVHHPDPDQVGFWQQTLSEDEASAQTIHGCCEARCCVAPAEGEK